MHSRQTLQDHVGVAMCWVFATLSCGGAPNIDRTGVRPDTTALVRFAIELSSQVSGPIYVSLNDAEAQPGWVTAFLGTRRIHIRARCEIEDCGSAPAVCGAAIPIIVDIASVTDRMVEVFWNGMTSSIDPVTGCEARQMAIPGDYTARFCYSREVELDAGGDLPGQLTGRLVRAACTEVTFTLSDREVVLRI